MLIWSIITTLIRSIIIWTNYCSSNFKLVFSSVLCFYANLIHLSLFIDASNDVRWHMSTSIILYIGYDNINLYNITYR